MRYWLEINLINLTIKIKLFLINKLNIFNWIAICYAKPVDEDPDARCGGGYGGGGYGGYDYYGGGGYPYYGNGAFGGGGRPIFIPVPVNANGTPVAG